MRASLPRSATAISVGSRVERPIGASMRPRVACDVAPHDRPVPAVDRAGRQGGHEGLVGGLGAGDQQEPGGALVEPVDDAGAARVADPGDLGVVGQQAVDEGAWCAGRRRGAPRGPSGLSITSRCSSAWTSGTSTEASASRPPVGSCSGTSSSTTSPAATFTVRVVTTAPDSRTSPARRSAVASERLTPAIIDTTRSRRSPASASGTSSRILTTPPRARPGGARPGRTSAAGCRCRPTARRRRR